VRRLFTVCSAVSLVICAGVCALWAISHWQVLRVGRRSWLETTPHSRFIHGEFVAEASCGRLGLAWQSNARRPGDSIVIDWYADHVGAPVADWHYADHAGISYESDSGTPDFVTWDLSVPCAYVAITTGALPALWFRRDHHQRRAARRSSANCCTTCGYDLRASPGRCPECGAKPG
jgi:hypothetical protein